MMIPILDVDRDGYANGPDRMILVGPPGVGKTHNVMHSWLVPATSAGARVLATTFTKAGALEMRTRLAALVPSLSDRVAKATCRTIHSEAYYLCRTQSDGVKLMKDGKREKNDDDVDAPGWEALMSPCKGLREEAVRVWALARSVLLPELTGASVALMVSAVFGRSGASRGNFMQYQITAEVEAYEEEKRALGVVDFTDLLVRALSYDAPQRDMILIDEAQDLAPLQIALVNRWTQRARKVLLVGDPDQGIYAFSGADGRYLTEEIRAGCEARRLPVSRRVPRAAHRFARELILRNEDRVDAPYEPADREGSVSEYWDYRAALLSLVRRVERSADETSAPDLGCTAFVLARCRKEIVRYAAALEDDGVPFNGERGGSPMNRKTVVAMVLAVADFLETGMLDVASAQRLAHELKATERRGGEKARKTAWFTGTKKATEDALKKLAGEDETSRVDARTLLACGLDLSSLRGTLTDAAALLQLPDLEPFMRIIERRGIAGLRETPRITLTTYHGSKGREADVVLVDCEAAFPVMREAEDSVEGCEGERRCLYVAVTRTRDVLLLVRGGTVRDACMLELTR